LAKLNFLFKLPFAQQHGGEKKALQMNEDYDFGLWAAECQGCDAYTRVNDLGLCEDCDAKLDRDLIRQRA
jgi:hypothetical protein